MGNLFREQPGLAATVAANPAFIEQVKVRKPHIYRVLLEKAQERFGKDAELAAEIRAQRESLEVFTTEGGKNEVEAERRQREARERGEKLLDAARQGNIVAVRAWLKEGADPNLQDKYGQTALIYAAGGGHTETVQALLESKANPDLQNNDEMTALMFAASGGYTDAVVALLEGKADPNIQDNDGMTALIYAAEGGHTEAVWALLESKANPNLQDKYGQTALTKASSHSIKEMLVVAERQWRHGDTQQERGR